MQGSWFRAVRALSCSIVEYFETSSIAFVESSSEVFHSSSLPLVLS
jgi:hypothetical protein